MMGAVGILIVGIGIWGWQDWQNRLRERNLMQERKVLIEKGGELESKLASVSAEIENLKNEDQRLKNTQLQNEIKEINKSFLTASKLYEELIDLREGGVKTGKIETLLALSLSDLAKMDYKNSQLRMATVSAEIVKAKPILFVVAPGGGIKIDNVEEKREPPTAGYSRQKVKVGEQYFVVDIVAADLSNTKVIVDTASEEDCRDNCPVLPLATYVARNGAIAGINGSYFCPASYPTCAGKTNSFDTLLMNKNKRYFNSDNNVYSTVPAVIFSGSVRYVGQTQQWGRDTGIDGMIANYPLLVSGGKAIAGDTSDAKLASTGNRAFVGSKGGTVYIGVVRGVSVGGAARVLAEMGMEGALNLDSGGSTALWAGGYKYGPGRDIPNAILLVRR